MAHQAWICLLSKLSKWEAHAPHTHTALKQSTWFHWHPSTFSLELVPLVNLANVSQDPSPHSIFANVTNINGPTCRPAILLTIPCFLHCPITMGWPNKVWHPNGLPFWVKVAFWELAWDLCPEWVTLNISNTHRHRTEIETMLWFGKECKKSYVIVVQERER